MKEKGNSELQRVYKCRRFMRSIFGIYTAIALVDDALAAFKTAATPPPAKNTFHQGWVCVIPTRNTIMTEDSIMIGSAVSAEFFTSQH
jgi:hypothetical protein